jgi:hypothetical protein
MNIHSTIQIHEHPQYNTNTWTSTVQYSTWTLQNTAEDRKYRREQDEYAVRKRTRAVKPIAHRYIHWIGAWMGPRVGLDAVEIILFPLPGIESQLRSPQSLAVVTELSRLPLMAWKVQIPDDKRAMFAIGRQKPVFRRNLNICIVTDRQKHVKHGTGYIREWPEFGTGFGSFRKRM